MNKISKIVTYLGATAVIAMTLTTCIDVLGRYLFNSPLQCAYELTGNFLSIIAACGIAAATATNEHICVDSFFERLSQFGQRVLTFLSASIELVVLSILCWQGMVAVRNSIIPYYEVTGGVVPIVTFPFRMVLALGFLLSLLAVLYRGIHECRSKESGPSPNRMGTF